MRNTTDWSKSNRADIGYPQGVWHKPTSNIPYALSIWDELTFKADYCSFRHKVKMIAMQSWSQIHGLTMVVDATNADINSFLGNIGSMYENYIILPTDDDDWYSPSVGDILYNYRHCDFIRWRGTRFDSVSTGKLVDTTNGVHAESNSFAFTKLGIESLRPEDREKAIRVHTSLYDLCSPKFLDHRLSVYNLNCSSISYLMNCKINPIEKRVKPDVTGTEWASPYLEQMIDLINGLRLRRDASLKFL